MSHMTTVKLVTHALIMMVWRRGKPSPPLHRSGPGVSYYTSGPFRGLKAVNGISGFMQQSQVSR